MADSSSDVLRSSSTGWFQKGTAKVPGSGTKKGDTRTRVLSLREYSTRVCEQAGMPFKSPVEMFLYMMAHGIDPLEAKINAMLGERSPFNNSTVLFTDGTGGTVHAGGILSREDRILCARYAAPYLHSKLSSVEITGEDGSPLFQADRERAQKLSEDPEMRRLLELASEKIALDKTGDAE